MSEQLSSDVKQLIYLGYIEQDVDVLGYKFKLHTLSGAEDIAVLTKVQHLIGAAQVGQMQIEILGRAIRSVNGASLEDLYVETDKENPTTDRVKKCVAVVGSWNIGLMSKLFNEYNTIIERGNKALGL